MDECLSHGCEGTELYGFLQAFILSYFNIFVQIVLTVNEVQG